MPVLNINHGNLEVETDTETRELRETIEELQEQMKSITQGQKEIEGQTEEKKFRQEDPLVRPKVRQPMCNKKPCYKTTLSTLTTQSSLKKMKGIDPSGGFAGAECREQQTRVIKKSNKEVSAGEGEKGPISIRIPATFTGKLEIPDTILSPTQKDDKPSGSGLDFSQSESGDDDVLEGEELQSAGGDVDQEGTVNNIYTRSMGPVPVMAQFQAPLIQKRGQDPGYVPFAITDMNCLVDRMPPPAEGGGKWMSALFSLT